MTLSFNPTGNLIVASVRLFGPARDVRARLILDTGATRTMVSREIAVDLGYDLAAAGERSQVITGSRIETMPIIAIDRVVALGQERRNLPVLCHTLPAGSPVDGLLGLDFFRGQKLTIDFRAGLVTLE